MRRSTHTEKTRTAKYKKCEIRDQNDAPHMRTKEETRHEKRSQKGGATYRVSQKFVPIVNFILRKAFNTSLGKCKPIQVSNLSK